MLENILNETVTYRNPDPWNDTPREDLHGCLWCGGLLLPNGDGTIPARCQSCQPTVTRKVGGCEVGSFTTPGVTYWVNTCGPRPVCSCPAYPRRQTCKHIDRMFAVYPPTLAPARPKVAYSAAMDDVFGAVA